MGTLIPRSSTVSLPSLTPHRTAVPPLVNKKAKIQRRSGPWEARLPPAPAGVLLRDGNLHDLVAERAARDLDDGGFTQFLAEEGLAALPGGQDRVGVVMLVAGSYQRVGCL